jgi:hypothetical protein
MLTATDRFAGQDRIIQQNTAAVQTLFFKPLTGTPLDFSVPDRASEKVLWHEASKKQLLRVCEKLGQNHASQNVRFVVRFGNSSSSFRTKEDLKSDSSISKYYAVNIMKKDEQTESDPSNTVFGFAFDSIYPFIHLKLRLMSELAIEKLWSSSSLTPKNDRLADQATLKDQFKPTPDRHGEIALVLNRLRSTEWRDFGTENFLTLATTNRVESTALQLYVDENDPSPHFVELVHKCRKTLMTDKLGCHVLRRTILKSPPVRTSVLASARLRLLEYSSCEHSSRVLQVLARLDEPLRMEYLRVFSRHWKFLAAHISAIYLFTVCLELTPNIHPIFGELRKVFVSNLESVLKSKNSKRVLVSYLEYCGEYDLTLFCGVLDFATFFVKRMDDKYMVYIFSVFLAREYEEAVNILIANLQNNMKRLLSSKYFKFLLYRIQQKIRNPRVLLSVYQEIGAFLRQISRVDWTGAIDIEKDTPATAADPQDAAFFLRFVPPSVLCEMLEIEVIDMLFSKLLDYTGDVSRSKCRPIIS